MDLKPISEALTTSPVDRYKALWKDAVNRDWYFEGWKQKLFIIFCFLWTLFSVGYLIVRFVI